MSTLRFSPKELDGMLTGGARWAVRQGYGMESDLVHCEEQGAMAGADPTAVSTKARQRGMPQSGTLGAGNHFLEIQVVKEIFQDEVATAFGLIQDQVCVMIHSGSRGLGHQVCTEHLKVLEDATKK